MAQMLVFIAMSGYQVENIDSLYDPQWFGFRKLTGILIPSGKEVDKIPPDIEKTIFWK